MAKTKSAPVSSASSAPAGKSKKPRHPGCNRIRNTFRSGDHGGLNHAICCTYDTLVKEGRKLMSNKRWREEHARREKIDEMMKKGIGEEGKKKPHKKESK